MAAIIDRPVRGIVIGAGQRGRTYALYAQERPDLFQSKKTSDVAVSHDSYITRHDCAVVGVAEPHTYWREFMTRAYVCYLFIC
jgi:hypothetical protein